MADGIQSSGARAGWDGYHATGTAPSTAAAMTFTNSAGDSVTEIVIGHASAITIKSVNSDTGDDLELSLRVKMHPDDTAYDEATTITTQESTTDLTTFTLGDTVAGCAELQVWWNNSSGAGTTGTEVSVVVK